MYLLQFSRTYDDFLPRFQTLHSSGDSRETLRLVHSLSGVAGTLGLDLIHKRAAETISTQAQDLTHCLVIVCAEIDRLAGIVDNPAIVPEFIPA